MSKFKITEAASNRISFLIDEAPTTNTPIIALRVSVDGGGCSGFMYRYELTHVINEDDTIFDHQGAKVVIDITSLEFLNNCTINFAQELGGSYFEIINPNATGKCGCGSSFAI